MGVMINSTGAHQEYTDNRLAAFKRAIGKFRAGFRSIPDGSFAFTKFVWKTLVAPVPAYGMEVYAWDDLDSVRFQKVQMSAWRNFLQVGGRVPAVAIDTFTGIDHCTLDWRTVPGQAKAS